MKKLTYATGNDMKFRIASIMCERFGVDIEQLLLNIPEIQAHDGETVARDKAEKAFEVLQKPVVVSDDSWLIPGLKNFPGPFMKFVSEWFTPEDWLRLTRSLTNRRIILRQIVVYQDKRQQKLFYTDVEGLLLRELRGQNQLGNMMLTSFDGGKTSAAEAIASTGSALVHANRRTSWHDLCEWLKK